MVGFISHNLLISGNSRLSAGISIGKFQSSRMPDSDLMVFIYMEIIMSEMRIALITMGSE